MRIHKGLCIESGLNTHIAPLANFNIESFPFILCSDSRNINLVNVSDGYIKPLIQNKTTCTQGQLPFFVKREDDGIALHFTSIADLLGSTTKLEWRYWRLTKEFSLILAEYGKLPESRTKKILKTMKQNQHLKRQVEKLTRHNEHL